MVYLDWAATAPPDLDAARRAADVAREYLANPSSPHPLGRRARVELERRRGELATHLGCSAGELVFTSGGTESNWIILSSLLARSGKRVRLVSSGMEHASVHDNLGVLERLGHEVVTVPARADGTVDPERMLAAVNGDTVLVTLMAVNNVTGAVQPVGEIARELARRADAGGRRVHLHTDAVQALGKIPLSLPDLGVDSAAFSAHKIGGPRGVGLLYLRKGAHLDPLSRGGEQENGLRPGTENLGGVAAFALAASRRLPALRADREAATRLDTLLARRLAALPGYVPLPGTRGVEPDPRYSPFIRSAAFPPVPSEVLVRALGDEGVCVSAGSACASSSREKRERVYRAVGVGAEVAGSAIRVSLGHETTERDVGALADALERLLPRLVSVSRRKVS